MLEGMFVEKVLTQKYIRPYPQEPQETSGYLVGTQAIYKYSLKDSDYPTLIIPDPLYDNSGGIIPQGYYELALSDSREFLILLQSKNPIAIIPVIKVEDDATEQERLANKTVKKETKKEDKNREKTNKKRAKVGITPDEPQIFMEADIEYNAQGEYYLVKYQRGSLKAWGAFRG
jgi:hypothetical protein